MMLQMPIVICQRSKFLKGRTLLNNILFWCSMILGLSMVSTLILVEEKQLLIDEQMCALYVLV